MCACPLPPACPSTPHGRTLPLQELLATLARYQQRIREEDEALQVGWAWV